MVERGFPDEWMNRLWTIVLLILGLGLPVASADESLPEVAREHCLRCHGGDEVEGGFDLTGRLSHRKWSEARELVDTEEMPNEGPYPSAEERKALLTWLEGKVAQSTPTAPAERKLARLTRDQYSNSMRDLLGIDLHPGEWLDHDGQGMSGFRNDREALSVTPAQMEKYLMAADRALLALQALRHEPMFLHLEAEQMQKSSPKMRGVEDGMLLVTEGQLISENIEIPADGYYEVVLNASTIGKPTIAQMIVGTEVESSLEVVNEGINPQPNSMVVFLRAGQPQIGFNSRNRVPQASLPRDANEVFYERAVENALQVPPLPEDATEAMRNGRAILKKKLIAWQEAYEWLRGHGVDGDPREIDRFRRYTRERFVGTDKVRVWYGTEVLGLGPEEWDAQWQDFNAERIAANQALIDRVAHVEWKDWEQYQGKLYVDSVDIRGPIYPTADTRPLKLSGDPEEVIRELIPRAFRREPMEGETERFLGIREAALQRGSDPDAALRLALSAILSSPHFLFHQDEATASQLSYFLWQSTPDDLLLDLQKSGELVDPEERRRQAQRMMADPRFAESMAIFTEEWLGLSALGRSQRPDPYQFPDYSDEVLESARQEPARLLRYLVAENRPVTDLMLADYLVVDGQLATFYGLQDSAAAAAGADWQKVAAPDSTRGGLLGMSAVLASTSTPIRTSPSIRGAWVWETLLGREVGDPLPDAGILAASAGEARGRTLREEMEMHASDPRCARCHELIDPIGLGLENYNAVGLWREEMAGKSIDAAGKLAEGGAFSDPGELKAQLLADEQEFTHQVARKLLSYALGRDLVPSDEETVRQIVQRSNGLARDLIEEIAVHISG